MKNNLHILEQNILLPATSQITVNNYELIPGQPSEPGTLVKLHFNKPPLGIFKKINSIIGLLKKVKNHPQREKAGNYWNSIN